MIRWQTLLSIRSRLAGGTRVTSSTLYHIYGPVSSSGSYDPQISDWRILVEDRQGCIACSTQTTFSLMSHSIGVIHLDPSRLASRSVFSKSPALFQPKIQRLQYGVDSRRASMRRTFLLNILRHRIQAPQLLVAAPVIRNFFTDIKTLLLAQKLGCLYRLF